MYEESVQAEGFSDFESAWNYFKNPISADTERREKLEEIMTHATSQKMKWLME